jgi:hypothetical protein
MCGIPRFAPEHVAAPHPRLELAPPSPRPLAGRGWRLIGRKPDQAEGEGRLLAPNYGEHAIALSMRG